MKPPNGFQRVKVPRGQCLAGRPEASVAIHWVTGGCEAYTTRMQAVKNQLRNLLVVAMPTPSSGRKAVLGRPLMQGRSGVAGVPSSGHASTGNSQEPRRALHLLLNMGGTGYQGRPEVPGRMLSSLTNPYVPVKVGNRRGSGKGRPGHPLEGRGEQTDASVEGNISETQNSRNYVHETRQTS